MFSPNHIILITGASSGIGKEIALQLNALGAKVLASGRNLEKLTQLQALATHPDLWINEPLDLVENIHQLPTWIHDLRKKYGKLWGFVHVAGDGYMTSLQQYDFASAKQYYDLNLHAPIMLAKGFADRRNYVPGGAMLFITSVAAMYPEKGHLLYGPAKAALANAAKVMSQEMASRQLRVHCLAPGIVDTPMRENVEKIMGTAYREKQVARYPMGIGTGEDIANMVSFLLSKKARWITGQNFVLSGGCY